MATHFDKEGNARDWMGRSEYFIVYVSMTVFFAALFLVLPLAAVKSRGLAIGGRIDAGRSPEDGAQAANRVLRLLMWIGSGTAAYVGGIAYLTFLANLTPGFQFYDPARILTFAYFVYMFLWLIVFLRSQWRRKGDGTGGPETG
jgi:hypothetical protein